MKIRTFIATALLLAAAHEAISAEHGAPSFVLTADTATLDIAPRAPGRTFLELPPLEYLFRLQTDCAGAGDPASFSINVADSRITLDDGELDDSSTSVELRLTIPSEQLAPVALTAFCVVPPPVATVDDAADDNAGRGTGGGPVADTATELLIPDLLAAHASLLCAAGDDRRMTYASRPLDLRLVCDRPAETDTETGGTAADES